MPVHFQGRRLSPIRLIIVMVCLGMVIAAGMAIWHRAQDSAAATKTNQWFGAYVDTTSTPFYDIGNDASDDRHVVLGFIVADPEEKCTPSWGGYYSMDEAAETFDLDRKVARVNDAGGEIVVSTGGLLNDELATACNDPEQVAKGYAQVLNRYESKTLDLDIEGDDLSNIEAGKNRVEAILELQKNTDFELWLTLPAATFGMAPEGVAEVERMLAAGVEITGVNLMTMNFGDTRQPGESMGAASIRAAISAHKQLDEAYRNNNQQLGEHSLWRKIGVTPMIGQNDLLGEIFTLKDAQEINEFVIEKGVGRVSFWSANRDNSCGENFPDPNRVSNNCSGIDQETGAFAAALSSDLKALPIPEQQKQTPQVVEAPVETAISDDPSNSPYPIWRAEYAYVKGDRIVWRKNVYEAKWWNQNTAPDAPVVGGQSSPWNLIGPVLPGDKPVTAVEVPSDLYPKWSPEHVYTKTDRVLFEGRVLEAKWWNTAQSPEAALQGANDSPWAVLDNAAVNKILDTLPTTKKPISESPSTKDK